MCHLVLTIIIIGKFAEVDKKKNCYEMSSFCKKVPMMVCDMLSGKGLSIILIHCKKYQSMRGCHWTSGFADWGRKILFLEFL